MIGWAIASIHSLACECCWIPLRSHSQSWGVIRQEVAEADGLEHLGLPVKGKQDEEDDSISRGTYKESDKLRTRIRIREAHPGNGCHLSLELFPQPEFDIECTVCSLCSHLPLAVKARDEENNH